MRRRGVESVRGGEGGEREVMVSVRQMNEGGGMKNCTFPHSQIRNTRHLS